MRIANRGGRLVIVTDEGFVDVEIASEGEFSADPQAIYARWAEFLAWSKRADLAPAGAVEVATLDCPVPRPPQIFAIGLNYREHAAESGMELPTELLVFTKFASCLSGPVAPIPVPAEGMSDWEIELVVVIGRHADAVATEDAWDYVAGVTVGQDISDRLLQFRGSAPQQFSLGKSRPGYGPMGPWVVTPDEFRDREDLELVAFLDDQEVQRGRTSDMIFTVPEIISRLSHLLPLLPGDVIFTGTPSGIGITRQPPLLLAAGQCLTSRIEGIGELRNPIVASPAR